MILTLITMTATRRTVTTSTIRTTIMTAMKMATTMEMMQAIMMIFQSQDILKQKNKKKGFQCRSRWYIGSQKSTKRMHIKHTCEEVVENRLTFSKTSTSKYLKDYIASSRHRYPTRQKFLLPPEFKFRRLKPIDTLRSLEVIHNQSSNKYTRFSQLEPLLNSASS